MIGVNRRRVMGGVKGDTPLPPGAVMIEYIGTYGSQYIDTGYSPSQISNTTCEFIPIKIDRSRLFGTRNQNPTTHYDVTLYDKTGSGALTRIGLGNNVAIKPIDVDVKFTLQIDAVNHKAYLNNTEFNLSNYNTFQCKHTLLLFALHDYDGSVASFGSLKLCSFFVEENNQKVIDMIPVRVGQVGYMYDKVSGELFGNDGTGTFTLGPDV